MQQNELSLNELRAALKRRRLDMRWSFDRLASEVCGGDPNPLSGNTLKRFVDEIGTPHETTVHLVREYLKRVGVAA